MLDVVMWQSGGCKGDGRWGHPQRSMSSDVAEWRVGADRERCSQCLTSSDVAEWRVRAVGGEAGVHVI